jgi:hypothetical protein
MDAPTKERTIQLTVRVPISWADRIARVAAVLSERSGLAVSPTAALRRMVERALVTDETELGIKPAAPTAKPTGKGR